MAETSRETTNAAIEELLLDYASGATPEPVSLLVATQLALRPELRGTLAEMEAIGGHLLEDIEPEPLSNSAFDAVLSALSADDEETDTAATAISDAETISIVPEPLRSYLGAPLDQLAWRKRGPGIEEFRISAGDDRFDVSLLRLKPGRKVPDHGHSGDELTLVLDGAFTDPSGRYGRGDLAVNSEDHQHAPLADPELGCICLAVTGGPLKFSNPLVRLFDRMTRD